MEFKVGQIVLNKRDWELVKITSIMSENKIWVLRHDGSQMAFEKDELIHIYNVEKSIEAFTKES